MYKRVHVLFSPPGLSGLGISDTDNFDCFWIKWVFLSINKDAPCERWSSCRPSVGLYIAEFSQFSAQYNFGLKLKDLGSWFSWHKYPGLLWQERWEGNRILKSSGSFDFELSYSHFINGCFHFVCNLLLRLLLNAWKPMSRNPQNAAWKGVLQEVTYREISVL